MDLIKAITTPTSLTADLINSLLHLAVWTIAGDWRQEMVNLQEGSTMIEQHLHELSHVFGAAEMALIENMLHNYIYSFDMRH